MTGAEIKAQLLEWLDWCAKTTELRDPESVAVLQRLWGGHRMLESCAVLTEKEAQHVRECLEHYRTYKPVTRALALLGDKR